MLSLGHQHISDIFSAGWAQFLPNNNKREACVSSQPPPSAFWYQFSLFVAHLERVSLQVERWVNRMRVVLMRSRQGRGVVLGLDTRCWPTTHRPTNSLHGTQHCEQTLHGYTGSRVNNLSLISILFLLQHPPTSILYPSLLLLPLNVWGHCSDVPILNVSASTMLPPIWCCFLFCDIFLMSY